MRPLVGSRRAGHSLAEKKIRPAGVTATPTRGIGVPATR